MPATGFGRLTRSFLATAALAAPVAGSAQSAGRPIVVGETLTIHSSVLGEDREIRISLPESYGQTAVAYPVLYILDGNPQKLLQATGIVQFLSSARNRIPEMLVVAIPNTNRNRDLTPGPGALAFQRFLGEELIPWVERTYRAAPERILAGHSLGGSFTVHTMLNRPELFDAYVAISAPLWRYDSLARQTRSGIALASRTGVALYLTVGEHENPQLRRGMERFADTLKAHAGAAPMWSYAVLEDENHNSTLHRSLYGALEARYAEWRFPFFEDSTELAQAGGMKALENHYDRFSKHFGYDSPPPADRVALVGRLYIAAGKYEETLQLAGAYASRYPAMAESLVNRIGYEQLRRGRGDQAVRTFLRNVELFPGSLNVHDSLGDGYCRTGEPALARESYQRTVRMAEERSHPRLPFYRAKLEKGCDA